MGIWRCIPWLFLLVSWPSVLGQGDQVPGVVLFNTGSTFVVANSGEEGTKVQVLVGYVVDSRLHFVGRLAWGFKSDW